MIKTFKHKGLKAFFTQGKLSGIQAQHAKKLTMRLTAIHTASVIDDIDLPGLYLDTYRLSAVLGHEPLYV